MKSIIGKLKPGSSSAKDAEAAKAAQPPENKAVRTFLDKVSTLVIAGTGDIRDLAGMVGPAIFSVAIMGPVLATEQNCWVGAQDGSGSNKVRFALIEKSVVDPKVRIPAARVVRTIQADKLDIKGSNGNLESFRFKNGDYTRVDLAGQWPRCLFVLTTQLTGCSFVIGCRGTDLYMGHAQRHATTAFGKTGPEVAASLKLKRQAMFQGVENLESTFLVGSGSEFKIDQSDGRVTYNNDDHDLNVIGLVCNRKFYCILATKARSPDRIKNVVLVTLDTSTKKWKAEEMPKTW